MNLKDIKKVHFVGIGGVGMSAMARMMLNEGKKVSGSDQVESKITKELLNEGVDMSIGHKKDSITEDVDLVVYTIAIPDDNEELIYARESGKTLMTYPQMLGAISKDKYTIAISGTHGKTTTTSMIAKVLVDASFSPTVIVGSGRFIAGDSKYLVIEACEYKRSFCNINPDILVVTNIEEDHLDYYKDLDDIKNAFYELRDKLPKEGFIVSENESVIPSQDKHSIYYSDYLDNVPELKIPGKHNIKNASCALAVADTLGIDLKSAEKSLSEFEGVWRRFEYKGETKEGALVYDDYAHHPTEIRAALEAAKEKFSDKKIVVAFHPHLFSRTKQFLDDFTDSLSIADEVIIAPIFAAREKDDGSVSSEILAEKIGDKARAISSFEEIASYLESLDSGHLIITMGAGDIYKVAENIIVK